MIDCIIQEIVLRKDYLIDNIETIYFGGGTPSILDSEKIKRIIEAIYNNFQVDIHPEITLEANPDDINKDKLLQWKSSGINRLSIGVQSFHQNDLEWMNRAHNARQAAESILTAQECGFENISCDLIYGTPLLTDGMWMENLDKIASLNIQHLSAYALTVEPKTALHKMIEKRKTKDINPQKQSQQFDILIRWAKDNQFEHYEISNLARKGFRSKHNSSYWQGKHYLGIGPSAHSFNGSSRQHNIANNALYLQSLKMSALNFEEETLTEENKLNEYIMISLRTMEGIDLEKVEKSFGVYEKYRIELLAKEYIRKKSMIRQNNHLTLTDRGKHYADGIAADLFTV